MKAPELILATDCGSTTTKAILFARRPEGWRMACRGEAPTTVEAPQADVTIGVRNAVAEIEELSGRTLIADGAIIRPAAGPSGVDLYISTSSAGGGLQMLVAGVVRSMTGESAQRAALGAGAIVMDTIACNDRRPLHEQIERVRRLRPDMVLLAGGVDGGTVQHVAALAELIRAADPRARLGKGFRVPVIYAGNTGARAAVRDVLEAVGTLDVVDNVRPTLEEERLGPARARIHELFMEHVMAQAPGYDRLVRWCDAPIMPTPGAVGALIRTVAAETGRGVICVDIGGATTDVFSVIGGVFNRTVSANVGMSYSAGNVLVSAGEESVRRWLVDDVDTRALRNRVKNKMIRPTTIPQTPEDLRLEQALAREALGLALAQHREFATGLKGVRRERTLDDTFAQGDPGAARIDMHAVDLIVGSGGVLSHAPRRSQAAAMMLDALGPEGVTELAVDSVFMMPHLGALAALDARAAREIFTADCLVRLGTVLAPTGKGRAGAPCMRVEVDGHGVFDMRCGELRRVAPAAGGTVKFTAVPARRFDLGAGRGKPVKGAAAAGEVGLILDARGRPCELPVDGGARRALLARWAAALGLWE